MSRSWSPYLIVVSVLILCLSVTNLAAEDNQLANPVSATQNLPDVTLDSSGQQLMSELTDVDSRLTIIDAPTEMEIGVPFEVSVLLEQNCCDEEFAPMPNREVLFYAHLGDCGVDPEQEPLAIAVTDEYGEATATLVITDIDEFTIGVMYEGEDKPTEDAPPNSACNPDERVGIIPSIDCSKVQMVFPLPAIECASEEVFACGDETVCFATTVLNEGAGDLVFSVPAGSQATIDSVTGEICVASEITTTFEIVVTATDSIGQATSCTAVLAFEINQPPTVNIFDDTAFFICAPTQICLPVDISDYDQNLESVEVSHNGTYAEGQICFTPYGSGDYEIVVTATDSCGLQTQSSAMVTISTEEDISIECPVDTTVFACALDTFCFPIEINGIADPDDITVEVDGLNTWYDTDSQAVCFFMECSNTNDITVLIHTPCNTYTCEFTVTVNCNIAPLVILPPDTSVLLCNTSDVCIPIGISDANNNLDLDSVEISGPDGVVFNSGTGQICFPAGATDIYTLIATATDDCGIQDSDTIQVSVTLNEIPTVTCPAEETLEVCDITQPITVPGF
ncbi:MAG: hypothetical protein U9R56_07565, partial [candidate division Zixibacteria bacterium]|nr:hypothetical protein [candidate division Zixibacteria bacterium]